MQELFDTLFTPRLRAGVWRMLGAPEYWWFRRGLEKRALTPRRDAPAVNYGNAANRDRSGLIHGGSVKLLHLAEEFPESRDDFNLLYLVSSAPPRYALDLVKWSQRHGAKLVWNQNGVAYPGWAGARTEEINGPMRELRAEADYIFYQSAFCRDCANRFLGEVSSESEIAYNCVDMDRFRPAEAPDTRVCQLLAAGSHHESYRVLSALETVAELERRKFPVTLHLAGRLLWRNAEADVARTIDKLQIGKLVRRVAAYRQEDAPALYQKAHILLHPKYKDPCPTVAIEAMACGVPVVGSASGGMPELVGKEAGLLLKVADSWEENFCPAPGAMADAVEGIMSQWPSYSGAARANAVARFSKEQWLAQHRRVLQMLAAD